MNRREERKEWRRTEVLPMTPRSKRILSRIIIRPKHGRTDKVGVRSRPLGFLSLRGKCHPSPAQVLSGKEERTSFGTGVETRGVFTVSFLYFNRLRRTKKGSPDSVRGLGVSSQVKSLDPKGLPCYIAGDTRHEPKSSGSTFKPVLVNGRCTEIRSVKSKDSNRCPTDRTFPRGTKTR